MRLNRIPSDTSLGRLEREYMNSRNFLIRLPNISRSELETIHKEEDSDIIAICRFLNHISSVDTKGKILVVLGPMHLLPYAYHAVNKGYKFRNLIALRLSKPVESGTFLPSEHFGAVVFTTCKSKAMNDVRKPYRHCKCCGNTVKDYGGKMHLMERRGTRVSDVWTDITMSLDDTFPSAVIERLFNMIRNDDPVFSAYRLSMQIAHEMDVRLNPAIIDRVVPETNHARHSEEKQYLDRVLNMDVFDGFRKIPDGTVNFALVDPPYNVSVKYGRFSDNMDDTAYIEWCKRWIDETVRTLKNGGILASVNIPRWTLELFPYLQQKLTFMGWIAWDALSYPHSRIISAHYPILCFSKGVAGSIHTIRNQRCQNEHDDILSPLNFGYCIRRPCLSRRTLEMASDRRTLSDLWTDIHRIRHNSFRYSHPTLMPQKLARRLILLCSKEGDTVLDCFNGVGTTTLVASSLKRRFVGIEKNPVYFKTSMKRHVDLNRGCDPFARKTAESTSSAKGYRKKRMQSQVPKHELQTEVRRVAKLLGRCPSELELEKMGRYPLKVYFDNFEDWAEITVATRRTGIGKRVLNSS